MFINWKTVKPRCLQTGNQIKTTLMSAAGEGVWIVFINGIAGEIRGLGVQPYALIRQEIQFINMQAGYSLQGTGHRAQGTGHRAQGTGHRAQGTGHRKFNRAISIFKPSHPTSSTYPVYKHTIRFPVSKHLTTDEKQVSFLFTNTLQITPSSLQTFCKDKHTRNNQTTR